MKASNNSREMDIFVGKTIDGYKILQNLGQGAYGSVYKVENNANKMFV